MQLIKLGVPLAACILSIATPLFGGSDLIVRSGGTLIVHTNVQVNSGTFTVQSGGAVNIDLGSKITATNVVYSGILTVSSKNLILASGQSYKLFDAPTYSGAFITVNLPSLSSNLTWTNTLSANGSVAVQSVPTWQSVQFGTMTYSSSQMVLSGSGGTPNGAYLVLTTTNVGLPTASWTVAATNHFDASGNFAFTNAISSAIPQRFFILQAP